jgi:hypothetical protein
LNFRQGLCFGALGAALAAGVAVWRTAQGPTAFFVLFGSAASLFGPLLAGLAAARPLSPALRAVLLGLGLSALPLAKLAGMLKAATHHRPLGAVTFAALALLSCLGIIAVSARLLAVTGAARSLPARGARGALILGAVAGPLLLLGGAAASVNLREGVFDVALGLGAGALLGLLPWPPPALRALELVAVPLWVAAVLTGILAGLAVGGGPAELASPALAAPISWMLR